MSVSLQVVLRQHDSRAANFLDQLFAVAEGLVPRGPHKYGRPSGNQTAEVQVQLYKALFGGHAHPLPAAQVLFTVAASTYDVGCISHRLGAFRWTRRRSLAQFIQTFRQCLDSGNLVSACLELRAILEYVGNAALLHKDLIALSNAEESASDLTEIHNWLSEVKAALATRGHGTRLDWIDLAEKGIRKGNPKSYKPQPDRQNVEAVDLLKGVDLVGKSVKGARKAYDFLSEFAHPNISVLMVGVETVQDSLLKNGLHLSLRLYDPASPGRAFLTSVANEVLESIQVALDSILLFTSMDNYLLEVEQRLAVRAKKVIKSGIKNYPEAFRPSEPCPCFSGKIVEACCGRSVRFRKAASRGTV